jgi:Flp pilus assembly protein TadD
MSVPSERVAEVVARLKDVPKRADSLDRVEMIMELEDEFGNEAVALAVAFIKASTPHPQATNQSRLPWRVLIVGFIAFALIGVAVYWRWHATRTQRIARSNARVSVTLPSSEVDAIHVGRGDADAQIAAYREKLREKPDSAALHSDLGLALVRRGKLEEAIAEYREAIRLQPELPEPHYNLGVAFGYIGRSAEAVPAFREAIRLKPNDGEAHYRMGMAFVVAGKSEEAIGEYREAIRLKFEDPAVKSHLARLLVAVPGRARGDYEEARALDRAKLIDAHDDAYALQRLALAEYRLGNWDEAIAAANRVMVLDEGGDPSDWFVLAMAHWHKGEKESSQEWFKKAVTWLTAKGRIVQPLSHQLWTEAAAVLGESGPDPGPSAAPDGRLESN